MGERNVVIFKEIFSHPNLQTKNETTVVLKRDNNFVFHNRSSKLRNL